MVLAVAYATSKLCRCGHIIKAGYQVNVYSRTMSKTEDLVALGARAVSTPKQVGENSDVVFSMVGYPSDVEQVSTCLQGLLL